MAYQFSYTTAPANALGWGLLFYNLKTLLTSVGWTVLSSSDGLTYFPSSDGITQNSSGAGGMGNDMAWFRIRQPSGGSAPYAGAREIVFQLVAQSPPQLNLYSKVSMSAGFIGGSPSATQTPSASDENLWTGNGTDASPVGLGMYSYNVPSFTNYYICADDASPWNFYVNRFDMTTPAAAGAMLSFGMDSVIQAPIEDLQPYVFFNSYGGGTWQIRVDGVDGPHAWTYIYLSGEYVWAPVVSGLWKANFSLDIISSYAADKRNVYNSRIDTYPVVWSSAGNETVYPNGRTNWKRIQFLKGLSRGIDYGSSNVAVQGDRGTLLTTNDKINIGSMWWPWNGGTV